MSSKIYAEAIHCAETLRLTSAETHQAVEERINNISLTTLQQMEQPQPFDALTRQLADTIDEKLHIAHEDPHFSVILKAADDFRLILRNTMLFKIEPLPPIKLTPVEGAPAQAPYTILEHKMRPVADIARMKKVFPKKEIRDLIVMQPARLVLHEMAAHLILSVSLDKEAPLGYPNCDLFPGPHNRISPAKPDIR